MAAVCGHRQVCRQFPEHYHNFGTLFPGSKEYERRRHQAQFLGKSKITVDESILCADAEPTRQGRRQVQAE